MARAQLPALSVLNGTLVQLSDLEFPIAERLRPNDTAQSIPIVNYGFAIAKAIQWLGNRYLLAIPMNATRKHEKGKPTFGSQLPRELIRELISRTSLSPPLSSARTEVSAEPLKPYLPGSHSR
jgi:hypothetical protein